jgi:hypothetical protein
MAIQTSLNKRNYIDHEDHVNEYDEEIDETEDDLIENYLYLTQRCGVLRHSPTTSALDTMQHQQQHQHINQSVFARQFSCAIENHHIDFERSFSTSKSRSSLNDFNNNYQTDYSVINRIPPTIYYNNDDDYGDKSFSLVKLFARMKARLKHDRRYKPKSSHELLHEEDEETQEWLELTKNIRGVLTKALLPDGGHDALMNRNRTSHRRSNSQKRSRDYHPVLPKELEDDENKIRVNIDDEFNTEGDEEFDEIIWKKFLKSPRGFNYRRCGVCKAVDRQQFQGQLVYIYGVANNILIDENLKASGLG